MYAITDQLRMDVLRIPCGTDHARIPVVEWRHRIVKMRYMRRTMRDGGFRRFIIRHGMRDGNHHLTLHLIDEVDCARLLRCDIHELDEPLRRTLQLSEELHVTAKDILRSLCSLLRGTDKRSLHIDTDEMRTTLIRICARVLHHLEKLILCDGHRRRTHGGDTDRSLVLRDHIQRLFRAIAHICAHAPVEVYIHEARNHVEAVCIDHLLISALRSESAIGHSDILRFEAMLRCIYLCTLYKHSSQLPSSALYSSTLLSAASSATRVTSL